MPKKIQSTVLDESYYDRPDKHWRCGHTDTGRACQLGPSSKGLCRTTAECQPNKVNDRWVCRRSSRYGGKCEQGPGPDGQCCHLIKSCQPIKSVRAKRGSWALWALGLTVGILLILFGLTNQRELLSPGELSNSHATLNSCQDCHSQGDKRFARWVTMVFSANDHNKESKQCQTCHDLGNEALNAHSITSAALLNITENTQENKSNSLVIKASTSLISTHLSGNEPLLQCASCHIEHSGRKANITIVDNKSCLVCHKNQFSSFNQGHPDFDNYPNNRRTHLNFDHVSHINKHFLEPEIEQYAPDTCINCHTTQNDGGGQMVSQPFEETCLSCHQNEIIGDSRATEKGIAILGLPGIDLDTLVENDVAIGFWPDYTEDTLSPFMHLFLDQDPAYQQIMKKLSGLDLLDLTDASDEQLSAVKDLIWLVKQFFYELEVNGFESLSVQLSKSTQDSLTERKQVQLLAGLSPSLIENARHHWFPDLLTEIYAHNAGKEVLYPQDDEANESSNDIPEASNTDEFNDLFAEEDLVEPSQDGQVNEDFDNLFGEDSELIHDDQVNEDFNNLFGVVNKEQSDSHNDDLIDQETSDSFDSLFGDDPEDGNAIELSSLEDLDGIVNDAVAVQNEGATESYEDPRGAIEDRASVGGWYREDFQLRYKPTSHADQFMKSWLDMGSFADSSYMANIFTLISNSEGVGACMRCHSVDQLEGQFKVNWKARQNKNTQRVFTRFSHRPHFTLIQQDGCVTCHQFDKNADYAAGFENTDAMSYASNFESITKTTCIECHNSNDAGQNCLMCHQYHIGEIKAVNLQHTMQINETNKDGELSPNNE